MGIETSKAKAGLTDKEIAMLQANSNLKAEEIKRIYEDFKQECPSGKMSKKEFNKFYKQVVGSDDQAGSLSNNVFAVFDNNGDGSIDFNEFVLACALQNKNDLTSKLDFVFELMDTSNDGYINYKEMLRMIEKGIQLSEGGASSGVDPKLVVDTIFDEFGIDKGQKLNKQQFINGCKNNQNLKEIFGSG